MTNGAKQPWWRAAAIAGAAGALGGFGSWLFANVLHTDPSAKGGLAALSMTGLGALAGIIGVVLVNSDRSNMLHYFALAVACGFFWRPVIEAGGRLISQGAVNAQAQSATKRL